MRIKVGKKCHTVRDKVLGLAMPESQARVSRVEHPLHVRYALVEEKGNNLCAGIASAHLYEDGMSSLLESALASRRASASSFL
jgi:hypothetical protein